MHHKSMSYFIIITADIDERVISILRQFRMKRIDV